MATIVVRELLTKLGIKADRKAVSRWNDGIKQARSGMKRLVVTAGVVTGAISSVTTALIANTIEVAKTGDEAAKAAQRVGVTAETMQELAFAAGQSGAAMSDVEVAFRRQATNALDAAEGTGIAVEAYERLGIAVTDTTGKLKPPLALFEETATQLAGLSNDMERAALAQDIFGRGGSRILPLLNAGGEGIRRLRMQAQNLGGVMSNEAAAASELFIDTMSEGRLVIRGIRNEIGIAFMPVLQDLAERFRDWFQVNRLIIKQRLQDVAKRIGAGMLRLASAAETVDRIVQTRLGGWPAIFEAIGVAVSGLLGGRALISLVQIIAGLGTAASGATTVLGALATVMGVSLGLAGVVVAAAIFGVVLALSELAALFGATALAIEDFIVFVQGGDSVLGELAGQIGNATGLSNAFRRVWEETVRVFEAAWPAIQRIANELQVSLQPAIDAVMEALQPLFGLLGDFGARVIDTMIIRLEQLATIVETVAGALERFGAGGSFGLTGEETSRGLQGLAGFTGISDIAGALGIGGPALAPSRVITIGDTNLQVSGMGTTAEQAQAMIQAITEETNRRALAAAAGGDV